MGNPIPSQTRTIDPFASYNSDVANRQIRAITNGEDCVLSVQPPDCNNVGGGIIQVGPGKVVKDDVLIDIAAISVDMNDPDFYEGGVIWSSAGYYYICLKYNYSKVSPVPTAQISIILPSERTAWIADHSDFVFLGCLQANATPSVVSIIPFDPDNPDDAKRVIKGGSEKEISYYSSSQTIGIDDELIVTSGTITLILPTAIASNKPKKIIKSDNSSTTLTIQSNIADTIGVESEIEILQQFDKVELIPLPQENAWAERNFRDSLKWTSISLDGTLTGKEGIIIVPSGVVLTLPNIDFGIVDPIRIVKTGDHTNPVTIVAAPGDTINNALSYISLRSMGTTVELIPVPSLNTWAEINYRDTNEWIYRTSSATISGIEKTIVTTNSITITLPAISDTSYHISKTFLKSDSNATTLTIASDPTDTIGGNPSVVLTEQWDSIKIIPEPRDNNWYISGSGSGGSGGIGSFTSTLAGGNWVSVVDPVFGSVYRATVTHSLSQRLVPCTCYFTTSNEMFYPLKVLLIDDANLYVYMPTNTVSVDVVIG